MSGVPPRTPVVLLTGFLGSGKTTLLARLLRDPALSDSAVLINEFGEVGLDHHLLERVDETTVLLKSGCLCCTVRGELATALRDLHSRRTRGLVPPFRRVVLETTGLADPLPALTTIAAEPVLRHHFRVGAVVTTVDAVNARDQLRRQPESVKQVAVADRLVLTKTDLCGEAEEAAVVLALRTLNPDAPIVTVADLDAQALLSDPSAAAGFSEFRCLPIAVDSGATSAERHGGSVASLSLVIEAPLDWTLFGLWLSLLLSRHGDRVLRVKGLLNIQGAVGPVAVHGVQSLVHVPTHLAAWPDAERSSRLVFITRDLAPTLIARSLQAFGVTPVPVPA